MSELICKDTRRREQVRRNPPLNGLDYLEVGETPEGETSLESQRHLRVFFLGKATVDLEPSNLRIEGGRRIRGIEVESVQIHRYESAELDDYMDVVVDKPGDFSTYTLRVVERTEAGEWVSHPRFDPQYDRVEFSFKVDCPSDLDCRQEVVCPPEPLQEPEIDYLAKDYASFRRLILDRLALVMPGWNERHVPDIGIALVEVLAYVGDYLSYYQDAVATEAYLDTARQRISVRRHARLVDYPMHEGCNARAWVCVGTNVDQVFRPEDIYFITGRHEALKPLGNPLTEADLGGVQSTLYEVFEPMAREEIRLYRDHNRIHFHTWGDRQCCLPAGSTRATLVGRLLQDGQEAPLRCPPESEGEGADDDVPNGVGPGLHLQPGDVLIFEEVIGPETGHPGDADPSHRHAVRLTRVEAGVDPVDGQPVVEIGWSREDALPFPLCISSLGPPPECKLIENVSVARGNTILVDHGMTREEELGKVSVKETIECCKAEGIMADQVQVPETFRPVLGRGPLTFTQSLTPDVPATAVFDQDPRKALPQVRLSAWFDPGEKQNWLPRQDLLASGPDDRHFVAEVDDDGRARLRFGDDECGEMPDADLQFAARYRIGNGTKGNVGAEAITHLVSRKGSLSGLTVSVRNPLPARGGRDAESVSEVKLFAPHAFRKHLQRAVTAADYAAIVEREFPDRVQRAAARLRWTGSWYEVLMAVDPYGWEEAEPGLLTAVSRCLHRFRRIGHDLRVKSAHRVPLDVELLICVAPDHLRGHVKAELLKVFSNRTLPDGSKGFFHPDNLCFGEGVYLSRLVAAAQAVEGVESVQVVRFQRLNEPANGEIEQGVLPLGPFEIARLDNDPSFPENGVLTLDMRGGR